MDTHCASRDIQNASVTTLADLLREEQNYATLQAGLETSWKLAKDAEKRLKES